MTAVTLPSRFFLAPINTGFASQGYPDSRLLSFHRERSGKGIGISYVGNVAIGAEYATNQATLIAAKDCPNWQLLTKSIREQGSLAGVQLACRLAKAPARRIWSESDFDAYVEQTRQTLAELDASTLKKIVDMFVTASEWAWNVGFQVIQVHAAHGYLLSQLLHPRLNTTLSAEINPVIVVDEILTGIRSRVPWALLDIRLNLLDGLDAPKDEQVRTIDLVKQIAPKVDMISLSQGHYDHNKSLIYPGREQGHAPLEGQGIALARQFSDNLWNVAGNIWDLSALSLEAAPNLTYAIGRSLIADSQFVAHSLLGAVKEIRVCDRRNKCHYYSGGRPALGCPVSSDLAVPLGFSEGDS